ncbi:MAG: transglutaminase family protein [Bacteroidota bacterium]
MRLRVLHESRYTFDEPVFLEPQTLRFRPAYAPYLTVEDFKLSIQPTPAGITEIQDPEGNWMSQCWFNTSDTQLTIHAETLLEIQNHNPFDFLIYPDQYLSVPFDYDQQLAARVSKSLQDIEISKALKEYSKGIQSSSQSRTVDFIIALTQLISQDFKVIHRAEGAPHSPEQTFEAKEGSCRDLAWMQIHMLRNLGVAARFVSGYYYVDVEEPEYELHAWVEAYLPGAGWFAFDPSNGLINNEHHITVAASAHYENTMPVTGTFRGAATGKLTTDLVIEALG